MTTMVEKIHGTPVRAGRDMARPGTSSGRIEFKGLFFSSGVMISIKSIDRHIGHERSVGVCFATDYEYIASNRQHAMVSSMFVR